MLSAKSNAGAMTCPSKVTDSKRAVDAKRMIFGGFEVMFDTAPPTKG